MAVGELSDDALMALCERILSFASGSPRSCWPLEATRANCLKRPGAWWLRRACRIHARLADEPNQRRLGRPLESPSPCKALPSSVTTARKNHHAAPLDCITFGSHPLHHGLLDRNFLLRHESPPSPPSRRQRFGKNTITSTTLATRTASAFDLTQAAGVQTEIRGKVFLKSTRGRAEAAEHPLRPSFRSAMSAPRALPAVSPGPGAGRVPGRLSLRSFLPPSASTKASAARCWLYCCPSEPPHRWQARSRRSSGPE